jgi:hypothetical protein
MDCASDSASRVHAMLERDAGCVLELVAAIIALGYTGKSQMATEGCGQLLIRAQQAFLLETLTSLHAGAHLMPLLEWAPPDAKYTEHNRTGARAVEIQPAKYALACRKQACGDITMTVRRWAGSTVTGCPSLHSAAIFRTDKASGPISPLVTHPLVTCKHRATASRAHGTSSVPWSTATSP